MTSHTSQGSIISYLFSGVRGVARRRQASASLSSLRRVRPTCTCDFSIFVSSSPRRDFAWIPGIPGESSGIARNSGTEAPRVELTIGQADVHVGIRSVPVAPVALARYVAEPQSGSDSSDALST